MRTYVIVYCGYEGIQTVMWAGQDASEARQQVLDYRAKCARVAAVRQAKRYNRLGYPWSDMDEPDRVCVMTHIEENEFLACCCALLEVRPSELVLM